MRRTLVTILATLGGFFVLISAAIIVLLFSITSRFGQIQTEPRVLKDNTVLELTLTGPLLETSTESDLPSLFKRSYSLHSVISTLDQAAENPKIKGLLIRLDFAAGIGFAHLQELRTALLRFKEAGKFIYGHASALGELSSALSTYYLATACTEIWLQPYAPVNLSGMSIEMPFAKKLLEDYEVNPQFARREEYKTLMDSLTQKEMTEANRTSLQGLLDSFFTQVSQGITKTRKISKTSLLELMNTKPTLFAEEAFEEKLIDRVAYFDELKDHIKDRLEREPDYLELEYYMHPKEKQIHPDTIAVIYGVGTIMTTTEGNNPFFDQAVMGSEEIRNSFKRALEDESVKAIVFRINSGGGSQTASETIWREVQLAQKRGVPVIASFSNYAASGGYWIASHCNKIVANPGTITGSIGVIAGKVASENAFKKFGVNWDGVKIGRHADMWSQVKPFDPEAWEIMDAWVGKVYDTFLKKVSEGRKLPLEKVRDIAKGRIWSGEEAYRLGLVDDLGDLNKAIEIAKLEAGLKGDTPVNVLTYPRVEPMIRRVIEFFGHDFSFLGRMKESALQLLKSLGVLREDLLEMPPVTVRG